MRVRQCKTPKRGVERRKDNEAMNKSRIEAEQKPRDAGNYRQNAHSNGCQNMEHFEMPIANEQIQNEMNNARWQKDSGEKSETLARMFIGMRVRKCKTKK
jgi:hypothetical protein